MARGKENMYQTFRIDKNIELQESELIPFKKNARQISSYKKGFIKPEVYKTTKDKYKRKKK